MVMAKGLAKAGARVVVASSNKQRLEKVAGEIGRDRCHAVVTDVSKEGDCKRAVDETLKRFGDLAVLINCARVITDDHKHVPFWEDDAGFFERSMVVNICGYFLMARAAAPHMIKKRWGRIVNVTTSVRTITRKNNSPYGVSKGANEAETLVWAQDLAGTGVTVNSLLPGGSCLRDNRPPEPGQISPEVMVPPALWLASDLSDGHTGERYVGLLWDTKLPIAEAAKVAREPSAYAMPTRDIR
jgi:NAD(P)-dependent dehydrogenase (short-subunit alcohol dehydrogenase family)